MTPSVRSTRRALSVALASMVGWVGCAWVFTAIARTTWTALRQQLIWDPADVLLLIVAALGALLTGWLGLATVAAALSEVPGVIGSVGSMVARRITPKVVRRAVALAAGTALATAVSPVQATAHDRSAAPLHTAVAVQDHRTDHAAESAPDPAFHPLADPSVDRPAGPVPSAPEPGFVPLPPNPPAATPVDIGALERTPRQVPESAKVHTVRRGDTLWDIAAARLGPGASAAQIAAEWPRWYAANRHVIGPDPALIVPGQRLVPPTAAAASPASALYTPGVLQ